MHKDIVLKIKKGNFRWADSAVNGSPVDLSECRASRTLPWQEAPRLLPQNLHRLFS